MGEKLDDNPHLTKITLIEQTITFCKSLMPQDKAKTEEVKKETQHTIKDGEVVLMKKEDREEEFFFAPTKKGKAGKKAKGGDGGDNSKKPIKHNAETFKLFDSLKLDAPITTADIPALLEKLDEQKASFEKKVQEWRENKED